MQYRSERGYAMPALLVALAIMAVMLTVLLPAWSTQAKREKEAELIFRGEQYARAIRLYGQRYANALPPNIDEIPVPEIGDQPLPLPHDPGEFMGHAIKGMSQPRVRCEALRRGRKIAGRQGGEHAVDHRSVVTARHIRSNPLMRPNTCGRKPIKVISVSDPNCRTAGFNDRNQFSCGK